MTKTLKDSLSRARKQAQSEFHAGVVEFMAENPDEPYRVVAGLFGVHRNYIGKLGRSVFGPRKRGRKPQGASRG